ncbi:MAG: hypothetical protein PHU63_03405, partial [Candidatus ainarchaeum sp.]|nr:hypothetical protein [Candidatus ainarchaeum sp.]
SLSVFGLFGDYKTDGDDGDPPVTTTPSLSISSEQNCNQQAIILSINDDEGNPVSNSKVRIEKLISGTYVFHGFYDSENPTLNFHPLEGNTYRAKAVKTGYEESDYIYFTYSCEADFTVNYNLNCEENIIYFDVPSIQHVCPTITNNALEQGLTYYDICPDGGCLADCYVSAYTFDEYKTYSIIFNSETKSKTVNVDTSVCNQEEFTVTYELDCDNSLIKFEVLDSQGKCTFASNDAFYQGLDFYDICAGQQCIAICPIYWYTFDEYKNYEITFNYSESSKVVNIDTSTCVNEFIFNYDYYCADNNELGLEENVAVLSITDQNGECIHSPYSINLSDLTIYTPQEMYTGPALVKYDPYACLEQIPFIFEEDASYTVSIEKDGFIPGTSTTSFSCTNQFNITDVIVDCDSNLLNFKMTDENGESVPFPYIIDAGELGYYEGRDLLSIAHMDQSTYQQESTFSGFKTISNYYGKKYTIADYTIEYPTLFSIPFTDDGDYFLTFTKEGFEEYTEYVSISCDSLDEEEIPDDENIIIIDKDGNKVDKENLSPGTYVMLLTDDKGQIVASKILTILEEPQPEPEDDLLDSILSQGSSILLLVLLLLGLGLYLYQRRSSVNIKRKK